MIDLPTQLRPCFERGGRDFKLLAIRLGAMGDILRTIPAVRLIRRRLPEAKIAWVLDAGWEPLLRDDPEIDTTIPLPRKAWDRARSSPLGWPSLAGQVLRFRKQVASFGADLTLDFHGNLRSGCIARWSGAGIRLGFSGHQQKEGNRWFTTHRVPEGARRRSRMDRNLDLIQALGIERTPLPGGDLALPLAGRRDAAEILGALGETDRFALLSPSVSAKQAYKKPPTPLLAAAVARLHDHRYKTIVVWGPGEEEHARELVAAAGSAAILAPATSLPVLAALIERARLFVAGDTGPMHLACALNCPVLAFYGPTDPLVNQPWGVPFRAVYPAEREYTGIKRIDRASGFEGLTVEQIQQAVDSLLEDSDP